MFLYVRGSTKKQCHIAITLQHGCRHYHDNGLKNKVAVEFGQQQSAGDLRLASYTAVFADDEAEVTSILDDISMTDAIKMVRRCYDFVIDVEKTKVITTDGASAIVVLDEISNISDH
ncbi:hypothetical protein Y032_0619g729 [Ancylostoma ceylanicum]|uniref:Uncharacterized protein n=1 Tax=Ancylostoma ceylanicum TaxID=53326 RepID=A0A016WM08_9BILA|nr:hypothetical protein Y032_0619g729 [Ancylostoma ceylanicum]